MELIKLYNEIFVFGSNLKGVHGAGAAKYARQFCGAEMGIGEGYSGWSYAIPTKDHNIKTLSLKHIGDAVERFFGEIVKYDDMYNYKITRIGCGLAGYSDDQIAPMFMDAPLNICWFDTAWKKYLTPEHQFWGTI